MGTVAMTEREYHQEICSIAADARKEAKEQDVDLSDYLHELIDGH